MNETILSPRQNLILNVVNQGTGIGRAEIERQVANLYPASKPTIARDLSVLVQHHIVKVQSHGPNTVYVPAVANPLLRYFDLERYFALEPDQRTTAKRGFDFGVFAYLHDLFSTGERETLQKNSQSFFHQTAQLAPDILHRELERFVIELAWKSSKIEGNTYSLLETETLIQEAQEASGHSRAEAAMILNHKRAFSEILANRESYQHLLVSHITQLHNFLVQDLSISAGIRQQAVGITGTMYRPLDNQWQIQEALEKLVNVLNKTAQPVEKALIANAMISYIQPFADGNKRTGRMLANAILLAHDCYPLSYRSVEDTTFKKAIILFYEQNSLFHLKRIFLDQYRFALETYFQTSSDLA